MGSASFNFVGAKDASPIPFAPNSPLSKAVSLRENDFFYSRNCWKVKVKIKGDELKNVPIPLEFKKAIDAYHFLNREHRAMVKV